MVLPPNIADVPPPGLALVEELDKLLLVQVRLHLPPPPLPPLLPCPHQPLPCGCCSTGLHSTALD